MPQNHKNSNALPLSKIDEQEAINQYIEFMQFLFEAIIELKKNGENIKAWKSFYARLQNTNNSQPLTTKEVISFLKYSSLLEKNPDDQSKLKYDYPSVNLLNTVLKTGDVDANGDYRFNAELINEILKGNEILHNRRIASNSSVKLELSYFQDLIIMVNSNTNIKNRLKSFNQIKQTFYNVEITPEIKIKQLLDFFKSYVEEPQFTLTYNSAIQQFNKKVLDVVCRLDSDYPNKLLSAELRNYCLRRQFEDAQLNSQSPLKHAICNTLFYFHICYSPTDKITTANKLNKYLSRNATDKSITFTQRELKIISNGKLGAIFKKYENYLNLPIEQERKQKVTHLFK